MSHFLLRYTKHNVLPASNHVSMLWRNLRPAQRVRTVKILNHETVFDLSIDGEKKAHVVEWIEFGSNSDRGSRHAPQGFRLVHCHPRSFSEQRTEVSRHRKAHS